MSSEKWIDIPGYEGSYQISDMGRVRSLTRPTLIIKPNGRAIASSCKGKILKGTKSKSGHLNVGLSKNGNKKTCQIHRLVMAAFNPDADESKLVRHLNGNPEDNRLENLCYGTHQENYFDFYFEGRGNKKLEATQIHEIREQLKQDIPKAQIARTFNISRHHVHDISRGRCYGWLL